MSTHVRLNVLFPPRLEMTLTEAITADPRLPGFTLLHAEGHTSDFAKASAIEQVRGRVQRRVLWMVLPAEEVEDVLDVLRAHVDSRDVRWWTESVLQMGRLG